MKRLNGTRSNTPALFALFLFTPFVLAHTTLFGQDFVRTGLSIGPEFISGASVSFAPPEGDKILPIYAWRAGVSTTYAINNSVDAALGLAIDSKGTLTYPKNFSDSWSANRVTYFSLYPNFVFGGFNIGMNFGFPLSATVSHPNGKSEDLEDGGDVPTLIEGRLGAVVPLFENETGWLSLVLGGSVSVTQLVEFEEISIPGFTIDLGDWHIAGLELGFRYEFTIPGTTTSAEE